MIMRELGALAIGLAVGYMVSKKILGARYEATLEAELVETREYYKKLAKREVQKALSETPEMSEDEVQDILHATTESAQDAAAAMTSYHKGMGKSLDEGGVWDKAKKAADKSDPFIYVLDAESYYDPENGYECYSFEYFAGDETLVGEESRVLTDEEIEKTVGKASLEKFGELSENKDAVYIRNTKLKMDIAISRVRGKYHGEPVGESA